MALNHLRLNWFIYESDIIALGGVVCYTGNVIVASKRSVVEKARVILCDFDLCVYMERFKDGTCVICNFLDSAGKPTSKNLPDAADFLCQYKMLRGKNEAFQEFVFFRMVKQVFVFLLQILCVCAFIHSVCMFPFALNCYTFFVEAILAVVIFIICTRMYSRIRRGCFANYTSIFNRLDE